MFAVTTPKGSGIHLWQKVVVIVYEYWLRVLVIVCILLYALKIYNLHTE